MTGTELPETAENALLIQPTTPQAVSGGAVYSVRFLWPCAPNKQNNNPIASQLRA